MKASRALMAAAAAAIGGAGLAAYLGRTERSSGLPLPESSEVKMRDPGEAVKVRSSGAVESIQEAEITVPRTLLEQIWTADNLELLARGYWALLRKIFLGLIRVIYAPDSRTVTALGRIPLLRFGAPIYEAGDGIGRVTWPIDRGVLVAREGRGHGHLRIQVQRCDQDGINDEIDQLADDVRLIARVAVENFYPGLRGRGHFARLGAIFYAQTQLRVHVIVCNAYLRSLPKLEFPDVDLTSMPGAGQSVRSIADSNGG